MENSLIIIDWDDTLFPTTWFKANKKQNNITNTLYDIDKYVYKVLNKISIYGKIVIITNATSAWITASLELIPKTKAYFSKHKLAIISARDNYSDSIDMNMWKKYTFRDVVIDMLKINEPHHIISIGDADYEYNALVDLCNWNMNNQRLLKTIRCAHNPGIHIIVDQLKCIIKSSDVIFLDDEFMDIHFDLI